MKQPLKETYERMFGLLNETDVPHARTVKITNADPDVIDEKHIDQLIKAYEKVDKKIAKQFKTLGDKYKKQRDVMGKYGTEPKKWYKELDKYTKIGEQMKKFVNKNL
tara:strand:- start:184 stop:504 length:321 start_codon:yes stop_codon:yes gene_type:complete